MHYCRRGQARFAPMLVILTTISLACYALGCFFSAVDWGVIEATGRERAAIGILALLLRVSAHLLVWVVCALAANGYGVTSYSLWRTQNLVGATMLIVMAVVYIASLAFYSLGYDERSPTADLTAWPLLLLMAASAVYALWFAYRIRKTLLREARLDKRTLLWRLAWALGSHFLILPLSEAVAAAAPEYERLRIRGE